MKTLMLKLFFFLMLFQLVGCAVSKLDVDTHITTSPFYSPETTGRTWGVSARANAGSATKLSVARSHQSASDFSSNPSAVTVNSTTELEASWDIGYGLGLGLLSWLDFTFEKRTESPYRAGVQIQPIGGDKGATGFKLSLFGDVGYQKDEEVASKSGTVESTPKLTNVSATLRNATWSTGACLGHRFSPEFVAFVSGYFNENTISSDLRVQGQQNYHFDNRLQTKAGVAGIEFGGKAGTLQLGLHAEGGFSKVSDRFGHERNGRVWGVSFFGNY